MTMPGMIVMPMSMMPMTMPIIVLRLDLSMDVMPGVYVLLMIVFHGRLLAASGLGPHGFEQIGLAR
jgi:hypothetical protein